MKEITRSFKVFILFSILLGLIYPLFITFFAQILAPYRSNGSLILKEGVAVGSELLGQSFNNPEYFHGRPSYVDYNASGSGASNFGPSNKIFLDKTAERILYIRKNEGLIEGPLPADMVLCSASGLDPHISLENALLQMKRIAKKRNIPEVDIRKLIDKNTDNDFIGIWGYQGVNVLKLNIDLDEFGRYK